MPFIGTCFDVLSLGEQPTHRFEIGRLPIKTNQPRKPHCMLGLLKSICSTGSNWESIRFAECAKFIAIAILACCAGQATSTVHGQQAAYPYPAGQPANVNTRGLLTGFQQQAAFQFPGQNQNVVPPNVLNPNATPLPSGPATFPTQPNFGTQGQPQLFPAQPNVAPQSIFTPQNGIPQGALPANINIFVPPAGATGKLVAGGTVGSDNGFVGEIILDERNFNLFAFPRSLNDLSDPRVFRGLGQSFRAEIVPGTDLERYLISIGDPNFLNSNVSANLSGYYFDRQYFDWDEQRAGAKLRLGRALSNFLSIRGGLQLENVNIDNPRVGTSSQLNADLGNSNLFTFDVGLVYDTRQSPYLLDSGAYFAATFRQAFGDFDFSRAEFDYRVQRLIYKRTATTGHHTLSYRTKLGFSGGSTPVFENFFAGGTSSLRGFDFRGVSPVDGNVRVGGEFQWLNSLEYQFPITNDDMIMGVAFVDFGTVEEDITISSGNFRIAPGLGLRANVPFLGISAPLSLDFAFAVDEAAGDDKRTISFNFGWIR